MTPRWRTRLLVGLALAVMAAAIYFPILRRRVQRAARLQQQSEEQARREVTPTLPAHPGQARVETKTFLASRTQGGGLVPTTAGAPLFAYPVPGAPRGLYILLAR